MKISMFGIGYVGAVSSACLAAEGHSVLAVDVNQLKVDILNAGKAPIVEAKLDDMIAANVKEGRLQATTDVRAAVEATQLSLICVGTPSMHNGNLDLSYVVRVCESIGAALREKPDFHVVVVRSTMLPGSMHNVVIPVLERSSGKRAGTDFGIAFYPEFLREGTAIRDYYEAGVVIFGSDDTRSTGLLRELVTNVQGSVFVTDIATAEAIKYANNAWHAAKIVFANEIGLFCKAHHIDSHKVMEIVCADKRLNIAPTYMKPGFAYGGSCLPKDLRALQYKARSADLELPMLDSLAVSNTQQIRKVFDMVQATGKRRVGIVGLSFKGGTDDMRESPAVELAEQLYGKGYQLGIFDHNVCLAQLTGANLSFIQAHIPHLSNLLTNDLAQVVEFAETLVVCTSDWGGQAIPSLRPDQVLIDVVRLKPEALPRGGVYQGLCW